jgi:hypothetical protein
MNQRQRERRARDLNRAQQLEAFAKFWKDVGNCDDPRAGLALKRAKMYEEEARGLRKLALKPLRRWSFLTSRVDRGGSRKQRVFMQIVGKHVMDLCGRALDSEVCVLNDIAFDTIEPTSVFKARSARRPSTRQARSRPASMRGKKPFRQKIISKQ